MRRPKGQKHKVLKRKVLLLTGLSGAGLSTALRALEDMGYKAVDNLPLSLVRPLLAEKDGASHPVAIGVDSRTWGFGGKSLLRTHAALLEDKNLDVSLMFIDCKDDVLQQRFTETRRVHPLALDRPISDGVAMERQIMREVRKTADIVIDTTDLKAQDLRRIVTGHFRLEGDTGLFVFVTSFGFKNGIPRESDLVFDVRFLDNPHWDPALRPLTGMDMPVAKHILKDKDYRKFFSRMTDLLDTLLPRYDQEGKNYLTIAIGCTGGKHRSVFTAEKLFGWVRKQGYATDVRHRDLEKIGVFAPTRATARKRK